MKSRYIVITAILVVTLAVLLLYGIRVLMQMNQGSNHADVVLWIEPWMPNTTIPKWGIPGVIMVYECPPSDLSCLSFLNDSLMLIKFYHNLGKPVFIALYPTWYVHRGLLTNPNLVTLPNYIISDLKSIDPSGKGFFIGFSEESSCLYNTACRSTLIKTYHELESEFPDAKFYYYDCVNCVEPSVLISFAKEANVSILGYDIYLYTYSNGSIHVDARLYEYMREVINNNFIPIIGEVGFRYCDEYAWYIAYQSTTPPPYTYTWNCTAPAVYLAEALSQISSIKPRYVGIWAWNDQALGIINNPLMIKVVERYVKGEELLPLNYLK